MSIVRFVILSASEGSRSTELIFEIRYAGLRLFACVAATSHSKQWATTQNDNATHHSRAIVISANGYVASTSSSISPSSRLLSIRNPQSPIRNPL